MRKALSSGRRTWHSQASALLLIVGMLLPFAQLAFNPPQASDSPLPACCRIHGKHKCATRMAVGEQHTATPSSTVRFAQVTEKCPCSPGLVTAIHSNPLWSPVSGSFVPYRHNSSNLAGWVRIFPNTSRLRSNHERGPPDSSLTA